MVIKSTSKADFASVRSNSDKEDRIFKSDQVQIPAHLFSFACFVLASFAVFATVGLYNFTMIDSERFVMLQVEILGLVTLREKIKNHNSASGISGMSMQMYACVYLGRSCLTTPPWDPTFKWNEVGLDSTLGFCSFLLVLDILKSIFVTHCKTYQAEYDVLKSWYLLPTCWVIAFFCHVSFETWTFMFQYCWNAVFYMDVVALMPQVVMMAMSGGKVAPTVANFVAATAISRCGDVAHTFMMVNNQFTELANENDVDITIGMVPYMLSFSTYLVIAGQFIQLMLLADFMYYYCRARTWTDQESDLVIDV